MSEKKKSYIVGRGKPPLHTRFKKGQSGNPKGRRKGNVTVADVDAVLNQVLNSLINVNENGRPQKMSKLRALITQIVNKGLKGHHASTNLIMSQLARRVVQTEPDASVAAKTDEEATNEFLAYFEEMNSNLSGSKRTTKSPHDDSSNGAQKPDREADDSE